MTDQPTRDVERFYDDNVAREWERLERHRTEYAVTLRTLDDYLPPPPARIVDIGAGSGRYALALAQRGYGVTLVDLSREQLASAERRMTQAGVESFVLIHASATDLRGLSDAGFDAVLLLGPLYHLFTLEDRRQAVREAHRLLRPGGIIFAAFISRYAPLRWAARHNPLWIVEYDSLCREILETGVQDMTAREGGFTHAYFAHPSEIRPLLEEGGFESLDLIACEGIVGRVDDEINQLDGPAWDAWVDLNYRIGRDPTVQGAAEHLLYIGKKPESQNRDGSQASSAQPRD